MNLDWLYMLSVDRALLVTLLIGIATGALVTGWLANRHFKSAGGRLDREARNLRELNVLLLESLEMQGVISVRRDVKGRLIGWRFLAKPSTGPAGDDAPGRKGRVEPRVSLRPADTEPKKAQVAGARNE